MTRRTLLRALALAPAAVWLSPRRRRGTYQATYPRTY
jgi:hypothetical protein